MSRPEEGGDLPSREGTALSQLKRPVSSPGSEVNAFGYPQHLGGLFPSFSLASGFMGFTTMTAERM